MKFNVRRSIRNTLLLAVLVGAPVAATSSLVGCGTSSSSGGTTASNEFTGEQIVQGMMGVGPAASRFGEVATLADRIQHTKEALQNGAIPAELLTQYNADMVAQPGDPLPAPRVAGPIPTEDELKALVPALDAAPIPTDAQFQRVSELVVAEMDARAPGYLNSFAVEMQSGDPSRVDKAMKVMKRSLIAIFESKEMAARAQTDPALAGLGMVAGSGTTTGKSEGDGTGTDPGAGDTCSATQSGKFHGCGVDPVVVPNQLPNGQNTVKWDQYAVGTRAAAGAYVGAVVAVAVAGLVWVAAVKGLGPFIPLANMHDTNPGDELKEEMKVGEIARAFAK